MIYVVMFIFGALFGSFYLVIGTRLPLKENVITGRSRCDHCKKTLKWYELIPIISFIFQKGKCNHCHKKISIEHLIVEIITGILFVVGYLIYGLTWDLGIYLILTSLTILIFISDFKYMIILDSPLVISSILLVFITYEKSGLKFTLYHLIYACLLFLTMYLIKIIGDRLFKKESLGGGDIKLSFVTGLVLGYQLGLISLIFASFLALPYAVLSLYLNKKNELPFGPFLISSALIIFIFIEKFTNLLIFFQLS